MPILQTNCTLFAGDTCTKSATTTFWTCAWISLSPRSNTPAFLPLKTIRAILLLHRGPVSSGNSLNSQHPLTHPQSLKPTSATLLATLLSVSLLATARARLPPSLVIIAPLWRPSVLPPTVAPSLPETTSVVSALQPLPPALLTLPPVLWLAWLPSSLSFKECELGADFVHP